MTCGNFFRCHIKIMQTVGDARSISPMSMRATDHFLRLQCKDRRFGIHHNGKYRSINPFIIFSRGMLVFYSYAPFRGVMRVV